MQSCNLSPSSNQLSGKNILLGVTGSVAAIRVPLLISILKHHGANIKLVATQQALHFIRSQPPLPDDVTQLHDSHEWDSWQKIPDPVLHIQLTKWAHLFIIAPLSANTLAKIANGICDNLLTCVARAWSFHTPQIKPFVVAPAMNTSMWHHPLTSTQLQTIHNFGIKLISPISKKLACGDVGIGAMEEPHAIVSHIIQTISQLA